MVVEIKNVDNLSSILHNYVYASNTSLLYSFPLLRMRTCNQHIKNKQFRVFIFDVMSWICSFSLRYCIYTLQNTYRRKCSQQSSCHQTNLISSAAKKKLHNSHVNIIST